MTILAPKLLTKASTIEKKNTFSRGFRLDRDPMKMCIFSRENASVKSFLAKIAILPQFFAFVYKFITHTVHKKYRKTRYKIAQSRYSPIKCNKNVLTENGLKIISVNKWAFCRDRIASQPLD